MKRIIFSFFLLTIIGQPFAQQNKITIEDIWVKYAYYARGVQGGTSMNDGKHYTLQTRNGIQKYRYSDQQVVETIVPPVAFSSYEFNANETALLLATEDEPVYRHSFLASYKIYDLASKTIVDLDPLAKQKYATFSPDGTKIAYVRDNNLFVKDLETKKITQITHDGEVNKIINGGSDWVYEEEFVLVRAFEWSPNSQQIAWIRFDESQVPTFHMPMYEQQLYPQLYSFKYPKVGEANSLVSVHVVDLKTLKKTDVSLPDAYEYIPRIQYAPDGALLVTTMNRLQNDLRIYKVDAMGKATLFFQEIAPKYLELYEGEIPFLNNGSFIWLSEQDGFKHIYLYDKNGKKVRQLTKGNYEVLDFYGIDAQQKTVFYSSSEVSATEKHIYSISIDGKNKKKLTSVGTYHSPQFSASMDYFVDTYSSAGVPSTTILCDRNGKVIKELNNNKSLEQKLDAMQLRKPEFFTIKTEDGTLLNAYMIKPADFDASNKYPVFMYLYGGPGSQQVVNRWGGMDYMWFQLLTQKGYIVVCVDNRGTGARGRDFRTITYGQLGKYETEDQISAARYLGKQSYVDASRIGIFGWSYGGYMSSLCLMKGYDVFKAAIAVAPVTNWKFYDNIYTERYMGTLQTNPNGFDDNAPMAYASNLKGNYLLIHGTADDNVHWQNAVELMNALIKNNKQFQQFSYPDKNHGIYGGNTRYHLYQMMTNFLLEKL